MNIPEGWKLVPVEPTQEILEAIDSVPERPSAGYYLRLYDAILSAAPTPPEVEPVRGRWNRLTSRGTRKELEEDTEELRKRVKLLWAALNSPSSTLDEDK